MKTLLSHPAFYAALLVLPTAPPVSDTPAPPPQPAPPMIAVTDLGTLGGTTSGGNGVNNRGDVAGTSQMPGDRARHAFLYADGRMTDLGTLGGDGSEGLALNDAGQVTGDADIRVKHRRHAFLWRQGRMSDLGTSRADDSGGLAINRAGQVAGWVVIGGFIDGVFGPTQACRWLDNKVVVLETNGEANSHCYGLDDGGQAVGAWREPGRHVLVSGVPDVLLADHAILWRGREKAELSPPGTEFSLANAVNDAGQIAGGASFGGDGLLHACVWRDGRMTDLGTLGGQNTVVYAINHAGRMAGGTNPNGLKENGRALGDADQPQHAFCVSGGAIIDLNDLIDPAAGWVLADARGLSDMGYVTGTGFHNGQAHAFLLRLPAAL